VTPYILVEMWLYFKWDYSLHRYVLEGGGTRPFPKVHKFLPTWTISNISRVCFIKPPLTLVSQTLSQLYNGSAFKNLIYSTLGSWRVSGTWIIVSHCSAGHSNRLKGWWSAGKMWQVDCDFYLMTQVIIHTIQHLTVMRTENKVPEFFLAHLLLVKVCYALFIYSRKKSLTFLHVVLRPHVCTSFRTSDRLSA